MNNERRYELWRVSFHENTAHKVSDLQSCSTCVRSSVSLKDVLNQITDQEYDSYQDYTRDEVEGFLYLIDLANLWFREEAYSILLEAIGTHIVIAAVGVDADESDTYFVIEL